MCSSDLVWGFPFGLSWDFAVIDVPPGFDFEASRRSRESSIIKSSLNIEIHRPLLTKTQSEMGGDEKKLYKEWPQAFRWTCCGTSADMKYGCDHHGTGSRPCTCDFCKYAPSFAPSVRICDLRHMLMDCRMGKQLTEKIYNNRLQSAHGKGLDLPRGPDPRSFNGQTAGINMIARDLLGMDN